MYCEKCGEKIDENYNYCAACGWCNSKIKKQSNKFVFLFVVSMLLYIIALFVASFMFGYNNSDSPAVSGEPFLVVCLMMPIIVTPYTIGIIIASQIHKNKKIYYICFLQVFS